jgi:hypothetical protein
VAALAAVVALFVALAGSDDGRTDSSRAQSQSAQGATGGQSPARSATRQPAGAQRTAGGHSPERQTPAVERIVVRGGEVVGGVKRLEYESGERVRFTVRSDVADEVHVHGFDIQKDVPANGSARFGFPADIEGVFDVELHHGEIKIAELRITP